MPAFRRESGLPLLTGNAESDLQALRTAFYMLEEELRYMFNNLDEDNLSEALSISLTVVGADGTETELKLSDGKLDLSVMQDGIDDAAKVATNFITAGSTGVEVGNRQNGSWSGYRTQMASDAFNILDAKSNVIASYGANNIDLGMNNDSSVISFCNNRATMSFDAEDNMTLLKSTDIGLLSTGDGNGSSYVALYSEGDFGAGVSLRSEYGTVAGADWYYSGIDIENTYVGITGEEFIGLYAPQIDVSGRIRGQAGSSSWYKARDVSLIASTNSAHEGSYFPIIDIKSKNGDWSVGALGDTLYFSYTSDEDYNAGNNITKKIELLSSGKLALHSGLRMANNTWLTVVNASGVERQCILMNASNQYFFGHSGFLNSEGASYYDGNAITMRSNTSITFSAYNGKGYGQIILGAQSTSTGLELKPATNATCALGVDGRRWKYLYLQNAPNVSSDRRLKKDISYSIANGEMLFDLLKPAVYRYSNDDAGKWHFGFIAQDAVEALEACGYDADDMSLVSKGEYLGMIYQELDALIVYKIQRLESRIAELEKTIA